MAIIPTGYGLTYTTIPTGYAAMANSGDEMQIFDQSAYGLRHYYEGSFVWTKAGTIRGMYTFGQNMVGNVRINRTLDVGGGGTIYGGGTLFIENLYWMGQALYLHANAGKVHFKNCIFDLCYANYIDGYTAFDHNGAEYEFDNCVFMNSGTPAGAFNFQSGRGTNAVVKLYHCAFVNCIGYIATCVAGEGASFDIRNCIGLGQLYATSWNLNGQDHANCDYNAVSGSDQLGTHDITGLTWAQADFASDGFQLGGSSVLYGAGANCGVATDAYGITRTVFSIGPFEYGNKNPGTIKVVENTLYWINASSYIGTLPTSAILSGIGGGTLIPDFADPANLLNIDTTSGVQGLLPPSALLSGVGAGTFIPDYSEPINTLANDTTSGVQGLISLSSVLSGISAGTLIPDYANPANLLNIDTSSGVTGLLPPSALLSGVGAGTFIPDYSEPINTLANDTTSGVQGLVSLASVLSGVSAGTYVPPTQPSISRVVSGVIYNDGNSEGKFVVPTIAQTQLNVKYGYNEEYTGEFIGTTIQVSAPIITIALNQTTNTTTFSDTYPGATNYLHIRNESSTINNYNPAGSRDGDGIIASSGLERGKHYTFFAASKVGDSYSDAVVSETIVVSRIPASGETTDHSGGWYSGITNNWGDNGSYDPEDSHDSGWYNGIQDIFDE